MLRLRRIRVKGQAKYYFITFSLCFVFSSTFAFFKNPRWMNLTPEQSGFWTELSRDFAIKSEDANPYIQKQITWYQQHPRHLQRILKESAPFIHYVYEQTQRYHLPAELVLIPLLESQYNPAIGAKSGAAGLWQMMPGTAVKFGLKINHSYDGRRDVTASTKAALTYLSYLYRYFNHDWLLALAAYESGEGKIQTLTRRQGHNYWNLSLSKNYVPRILAIAHIIKQPNLYHVSLPAMSNQPSLQELTWNEAKVINLNETAKSLGLDNKTFKFYNPGIRQNVATIPNSVTLLIPGVTPTAPVLSAETEVHEDSSTELTKQFASEVELEKRSIDYATSLSLPPPTKINLRSHAVKNRKYTLKKGDNLSIIAKKFHTTVPVLKKINHLKNEKRLRVGSKILIGSNTSGSR